MSRRNRYAPTRPASTQLTTAKAKPLVVSQSPDELRSQSPFIPFGNDPYEEYLRAQGDLITQRAMILSLFERCSATAAIKLSVADEIASQEIFVTPLESNPSATTILLAKRAVDIMNMSMNRAGGLQDFISNFITSYWGSKTGVFIATPRDEHGNITSISVIHPILPRPYYGWNEVSPMQAYPTPVVNPLVGGMNLAEGIWYTDGGLASRNWFALSFRDGQYWQSCPEALAWGAFQEGKPKAEYALSDIVNHIALNDYMRRTTLCTDDAQVILWENVDDVKVTARANQLRDIARRRKEGKQIDKDDEGVRLHVWAKDPDRPAKVTAVNLRAFAEGFDPIKNMQFYGEQIALEFGVNAKRASPDTQRERFGNAAQAAMLNADEPGVRAIKITLSSFVNNTLLGGLPVRSEFQNRGSAENYAQVTRDVQAAQVIAQAGAAMTQEQQIDYLVRMGVLQPSDVGHPVLRVSDSLAYTNPLTQGFLSLRDAQGYPLTVNKAIELIAHRPQMEKALVLPHVQKAVDPDFEACALEATTRYEEWITSGLPTAVQQDTLSRNALEDEVDSVTQEIWTDLVRCARANGARSADPKLRLWFDFTRGAFFNLFGSPRLRVAAQARPANNLFDTLWNFAGKIALGTATALALQTAAAVYVQAISRYFNAARAAVYFSEFNNTEGPVEWKLGPNENHCSVCPKFAHTYPSFADLMSHTGGILPGDIRLPDKGNCKCTLVHVTG